MENKDDKEVKIENISENSNIYEVLKILENNIYKDILPIFKDKNEES